MEHEITVLQSQDSYFPVFCSVRYWDIANSKDGDYTASSRMDVTSEPHFIMSQPVRMKGLWGNNYPYIKSRMLQELDVLHVFETEGVGAIAWQMITMDIEISHIMKAPATKIFTSASKEERAQLWALEMLNGRMSVVLGENVDDFLDEIAAFPNGNHDDWVDGVSGNMLSFIYFFGGYKKLLDAKRIKPKQVNARRINHYENEQLISQLGENF